ncbi:MAG TPA: PQQ-binding-like beta-propeller repeat protein [Sandaracinaceae bacterium LLY-WYZ-13_1]|nr:PQQ-binding-like beta-propeller repeat protein [Sandaracinaceae bacterium LLY-WYZ-13_1]
MRRLPWRTVALCGLLLGNVPGCGPGILGGGEFDWLEDGRDDPPPVSTRAIQLRWRRQLTPDYEGAYVPVERSAPALDPSRDRIYVGTSAGQLLAMSSSGARIYGYEGGGGIMAQPALDVRNDELYVATEDGVVHRLRAEDGELVWRAEIGGAVSQPMILTEDALYLVTDDDSVVALDRDSGDALWRFRRDAPEGFYVSHHAGITLTDGRLLTATTSGVVVSLDPADGSLQWERDTSVELEPGPDGTPRFADVDSTPLVMDDVVYVASYAGGMYALELASGTVRWRDEELTGIVSMEPASDRILILSSGDLGVVALDRFDREILWRRQIPRGAPAEPLVARDLVLFGETQGGFITLALQNGRELGRIETGHGFNARASVIDGRGFVLSNGGSLLAFALPGAR